MRTNAFPHNSANPIDERPRDETYATVFEAMVEIRTATESLDYDDGDVLEELKAETQALDDIRDLAYRAIRRCRLSPASQQHDD
jgi:hypothetical protein